MLRCPACGRDMPAYRHVCEPCERGLLRDLDAVRWLSRQLDLAITRQTRLGERGGRASETGLSWDERARTAEQQLRAALAGWVRALHQGVIHLYAGPTCRICSHASCLYRQLAILPADTLPAMASWLLRHRRPLFRHPAVDKALDQIRQAVRHARRVIDLPAEHWYAGPCNTPDDELPDDEEQVCQADLYARHGARDIRCRTCDAHHDIGYRFEWIMEQAEDHLGTASEIARALSGFGEHITAAMIRGYAHRGRLATRGHHRTGQPLYRLGDVLQLLGERERMYGPACARCGHATCRTLRGERTAA